MKWMCVCLCSCVCASLYLDHACQMSLQLGLKAVDRLTGAMEDKVRQVGGGVAEGREEEEEGR